MPKAINACIALALVLVSTTGCLVNDPEGSLGLTRDDQGRVSLYESLCENEVIERVDVDDDDDRNIWAIESPGGSSDNVIALGTVPEGFEELKRLSGPLPERVTVEVRTSLASDGRTFLIEKARAGKIWDGSDYFEAADFDRRYLSCP